MAKQPTNRREGEEPLRKLSAKKRCRWERHTQGRAPQKSRPHPLRGKATRGDDREACEQIEGRRAKNRRARQAQRSGAQVQQLRKHEHDPKPGTRQRANLNKLAQIRELLSTSVNKWLQGEIPPRSLSAKKRRPAKIPTALKAPKKAKHGQATSWERTRDRRESKPQQGPLTPMAEKQ